MKYAILLLLTLTLTSCSTFDNSKSTFRKTSSVLNDFSIFYIDSSYNKNGESFYVLEPHYFLNSLSPGGKINLEDNKVIVELSKSIGADPKDKDAYDGRAICDGEEKTSGWYAALLASAQVEKLSFEEMKTLVNEDVLNNCKAMGGEIITDNGNEIKIIFESKGTRLRQKGIGTFSKLIPEKRNCYHYEALVKCDMTSRKKEILKRLESLKEIHERPMKH